MSSPGQRRGSCGHAMARFDSHSKCACCRDKGLGDDLCVQKKECAICRGFTPEQTLQLSTPTYRDRKDKKATASSSTPTLVDPAHVARLEAILLSKTFTVTVEPVVKPASDVTTSQKPFFILVPQPASWL